jgi:glycosyltransferase involved in cell wall biosynthesis
VLASEADRRLFSVIIPAYNSADVISEQLSALAEQQFTGDWEVLVSNNRSTDATVDVVREFGDRLPGLQVIAAEDRQGRSYARNIGAAHARGNHLLFVDADDIVAPGWLEACARAATTQPAFAGALMPFRLNEDGTRAWAVGFHRAAAEPVYGFLRFAPTGNVGIRADLFRTLGGFSEEYPTGEDAEFSWRLQLMGYDFGFEPDALLYVRLRSSDRGRAKTAFRDSIGVTHLYRDFRAAGMPRSSTSHAVHEWLAITRQARSRLKAQDGSRATWWDWAGMRAGYIAGSVRYRVLYL